MNLWTISVFGTILLASTVVAKLGSSRTKQKDHASDKEDLQNSVAKSKRLDIGKRYMHLENLKNHYQKSAVPLSTRDYRQLVFQTPRNFSCFVLFYNSVSKTCSRCEQAASIWRLISQLYYQQTNVSPESVYFVAVDMDHDYQKLKVDVDPTVPTFYYFAESHHLKYNPFIKFDLDPERGLAAPALTSWIKETSNVYISLQKIHGPSKLGLGTGLLLSIFVCGLYLFWRHGNWDYGLRLVKEMNYAYLCVVGVLFFVSGQMYNQIRGMGLAYYDGDGKMIFISPSFRGQLLTESYIIMFVYALIVYCIIQLIQIKDTKPVPGKPYSEVITNKIHLYGAGFFAGFVILNWLVKMKQ